MKKNIYIITINIVWIFIIVIVGCQCAMNPPDEIIVPMPPLPDFGINETVENTYGSDNYYTYYIDNSDPNSTDTNNSHGSKTVPRLTLPNLSTLIAGDVVEIHGTINTGSTNYHFNVDATSSQPIFIRGKAGSEPVIRALFNVKCKYIIFENLIFDQNDEQRNSISIYPSSTSHPIDHIAVRYCEVRHYQQSSNSGGHNSTLAVTDAGTGKYPHHIVFYDNEIHDNGNSEGGRDIHAILVGASEYVWILNNEMYNNAGDSVQVTTGEDPEHSSAPPTNHIYISSNIMHGEHENAVDLKRCQDVIIANNIMYDFWDTYGTWGGGAIILHMGGYYPYTPARILIIHNEIYNCEDNAITTEDDTYEVYMVGNILHDIGLTSNGSAVIIWAIGSHYIYNNLFYNVYTSIWISTGLGASNSRSTTDIKNNMFVNMLGYDLNMEDGPNSPRATHTAYDYNLFYEDAGNLLFYWNDNYTSLLSFQTAIHQGYNCIEENPLFMDAAANDFRLNTLSPAINKGIDAGDLLQNSFKISNDTDFAKKPRPVGLWDIGPHEYQ